VEELVKALTIGVTNGLIIALIAIGYTLVYGILELINFAHADVFMLGTAFTYFATELIVRVRHPRIEHPGSGRDAPGAADHHADDGDHQRQHRASRVPTVT
jgi:hypothetical protein